MSHRLLITFLLMFVLTSLLGAIMHGGGGIVSTTLLSGIDDNDILIPVVSTNLFADRDVIQIGAERMLYISTAEGVYFVVSPGGRGYGGTTAANHTAGQRVYSQEAGILNEALGFNVAVQVETGGTWGVIMLPITFLTTTVPHMIVLNASFLQTPELSIIAILWMVAGIALIVMLAIAIAPVAVGLLTGFVGLIRR